MPMNMEQSSETSVYKFQTPGYYPKESIQHTEHGESLKSRSLILFSTRGSHLSRNSREQNRDAEHIRAEMVVHFV